MKLWHAIGFWTLESNNGDHIFVELARLEGYVQFLLRVKHAGGSFDDMTI